MLRAKSWPRASQPWILDSGAFTELGMYGRWTLTAKDYVREVKLWQDEVGSLEWALPMDWMCEPFMIRNTGLSVREHQRLTTNNLIDLLNLWPDGPWMPSVQGWTVDDYRRHVDRYEAAGIDLRLWSRVAVGSVCRRQSTEIAGQVFRSLYREGLHNLHGLGVKTNGLIKYGDVIASSDSMSWSVAARREGLRIRGHVHSDCRNCLSWALLWRRRLLRRLDS